ncbi:MAG: DUF58 domain-containing protein [bacterium]
MTHRRFQFLRPEDIRSLAGFEFAPKAVVEGYFAGRHVSRSRGSSVEFRDYRQYVPGDDLAMIDWRVYGRTDRFYLRTYDHETSMDCHLFLDSSASMGFGKDPSKLEYASFFTACLAYLVIRGGDRVSLQIFDKKIRTFLPPGSTGTHLNGLLNVLERNRPGELTSLAESLRSSFPLLKRRGILVVVSDFFDNPAAIFTALGPYLHRGFKVFLFHVLTPAELELEDKGLVSFRDLETGQRVTAHTDDVRAGYRDAIGRHIDTLRDLAKRRSVDYTVARTDTHFHRLFERLTQ